MYITFFLHILRFNLQEQKRYKRLHMKMGAAPTQETGGGASQDASFIDIDKESQPMDIGDKE